MKTMKIFAAAALTLAVFASCSKLNEFPVFEEDQSFVAFAKATYMVAEDSGQLSIPVSLGAYGTEEDKTLPKTNVSYTILDASLDGGSYTAVKDVDFKDTNVDGVLSFDGSKVTQNIVIDIINRAGEYTGDITFGVLISTASNNMKISSEKLVKVTITDNDHPLASILGEYTVTCKTYDGSAAQDPYTLTLTKDPDDVHVVHIDYITPGCKSYSSWGDWSCVGTVSEDLKTITIARGQICGQGSEEPAWYQSADDTFELHTYVMVGGSSLSVTKTGSFEMVSTTPGVFSTEENIWLYPAVTAKYYTNFVAFAPVWTKK